MSALRKRLLDRMGILSLWELAEKVYLNWAIREINPMHPDVPHIVRRLNELNRGA